MQFHAGWITSNDMYWGEEADGRLLLSKGIANWTSPEYSPSPADGWQPAREAQDGAGGAPGAPMPLDMPSIASGVDGTVAPIANWTAPSPDGQRSSTVFDFGANLGGWTRLVVSGPAGAWVRVGHAERVHGGGFRANHANGLSSSSSTAAARGGLANQYDCFRPYSRVCVNQTNTYTLAGTAVCAAGDPLACDEASAYPFPVEIYEPRFAFAGFQFAQV